MLLKRLEECTELSYNNYLLTFENVIEKPFSSHLTNLSYSRWIEISKNFENKDCLLVGYVPSYTYFLVNEKDEIAGNVSIRTELNDYLNNYGGNIGYVISPNFRGQGFGTLQLSLALEAAKKLNLVKVLLTCDKSNTHSASIILKNKGILDSESIIDGVQVQRYWISIK